jgi:uracil-DNA glycosylase
MKKTSLIIGQAKGEKWKLGPMFSSKLWDWFATIGLTREEAYELFQFDALIDHGTLRAKKGRVPPNSEQMKNYRPTLIKNIDKQKPKLIIPIGNLAIRQCFNRAVLLEDVIGNKFTLQPFGECKNETLVIPIPHPSGVSLWLNSASNKKLLEKAMHLIKQELALLA